MPSALTYRRLMERLPIRLPNLQIWCPWRLNTAQETLWQAIAPQLDRGEPIRVIILKARRLGMSTLIEALLTAMCVLSDYVQAMVIAHEAPATKRIWANSARFVTDSPLRAIGTVRSNQIRFGNSLLELATAGSPDATRGSDLTACHLSEVAFWRDPDAMLAILQCLPRDETTFSVAVIESTANGMVEDGALFYEEWMRAVAGESGFVPVFLPWHTFPQYRSQRDTPLSTLDEDEEALLRDLTLDWAQLRWRRRVLTSECQGDVEKFNQEYPSTPEMAFIMSGLPFFRQSELLWVEKTIETGRTGRLVEKAQRLSFVADSKGWLTVFRPPRSGRAYVIGADSSMGIVEVGTAGSHSRSAACVLDMESLEQCAEYDAATAPHVFAAHLAMLGRYYKDALLAPEVQSSGGGGGREIIVYLRDQHEYWNLHVWRQADRIRRDKGTLYGWETTVRTRPRMIARIREVVQERSALIHSRRLLTQVRNFGENESGRLEALAGHDDLLFAWGIALMSRSENYIANLLVGQPSPPGYGQESFEGLQLPWWPDIHELYEKHREAVERQQLAQTAAAFLRA